MVEQTQLISPTLIPDMDKLMAIRVDTPRYWPFYLGHDSSPTTQNHTASQPDSVRKTTYGVLELHRGS